MGAGERSVSVDETTLINKLMPKTWTCPHCRRQNRTGQQANNILMEHFKYLEHCGGCGYVHFWRLKLTDDFKKMVVRMLEEGAMP